MKTQPTALMLAASLALLWTLSAGAQDLNWPEQAEARIDAILKIKREAMRLPGMRSASQEEGFGFLGRQAEVLMDELAGLVSDPAFVAELEKAETNDIRAKIALWALDRKNRPEEYVRFAKWYVNRPPNEEAIDYFYRLYENTQNEFLASKPPSYFVPRPGTWRPHQIDEEDRIEANRHILEYCFFMPPTARAFKDDLYRIHMVISLLHIQNPENSLIVVNEDMRFYASIFDESLVIQDDFEKLPGYWNSEGISFLASIPNHTSFRALAEFFTNGALRAGIKRVLAARLAEGIGMGLNLPYHEIKSHYDKWMALASREWSEPHEKEFAEWLKTVPIKDPPPPVNPNNPFGTFDEVE